MRYLQKKACCAVLALAIAPVLLSGCSYAPEAAEATEAFITATEAEKQRKEGLQTLLVVYLEGFDISGDSEGYRNRNRADLIMLMIMDEDAKKTTALQLNPDTAILFCSPGTQEALQLQLGLAFSYGSGGSDSCLNQQRAVSDLLEGISIDHYMMFTTDAIAIVNDMLGGVTVTATEDYAQKQPELSAGDAITLFGEDAVNFFCFREDDDVTNEAHMERQRRYMAGFYTPFLTCTQQENFLTKLTLQLGDGFSTDLTLSQMVQMIQSLGTCPLDTSIVTIPGSAEKETDNVWFYIDEEQLSKTVNNLFFS